MIDNSRTPSPGRAIVTDDPRILVAFFFLVIIASFAVTHAVGMLVLLGYLVLLQQLARLPFTMVVRNLKTLSVFFVLIVALNALLVDGTPLRRPFTHLSREGLEAGLFYGLRVLVLYAAVVVFLSPAKHEAIAAGLASLVRPVSSSLSRRAALYGFLMIGFLPLFVDEIDRVRIAQRFRGGGLDGGLVNRLRGVRLLIVPLIVSAIHRSGQLALAVELREIRRKIERLYVGTRLGYRDVTFAGFSLAVLLVAVIV